MQSNAFHKVKTVRREWLHIKHRARLTQNTELKVLMSYHLAPSKLAFQPTLSPQAT